MWDENIQTPIFQSGYLMRIIMHPKNNWSGTFFGKKKKYTLKIIPLKTPNALKKNKSSLLVSII